MTRQERISTADTAPSDLHIRLLASAIRNGDFTQVPLNFYSKLDWVDVSQWFADVSGEPEDEAQAVAEIELMLAKSDYFGRWMNLSERLQYDWGDFHGFWDALGKPIARVPLPVDISDAKAFPEFAEALAHAAKLSARS